MNRTLDHAEAWELLNDYVDEALPEAQKVAVERHLKGCRTCRHEIDGLRELIRQTASLAQGIEPQRDLWPGVAAAVRGEAGNMPDWLARREAQRDRRAHLLRSQGSSGAGPQ